LWEGAPNYCRIVGPVARITGPGTFKLDAIIQGTSGLGTIDTMWIDTGGTVKVGDVLRTADIAGIAPGGSLEVVTEIGYGASDHFHVTGDIAGTLTADSVDTHFQVEEVVSGRITQRQG
jgi:hypothetical protein